jgi:formate dehydrogenase subunit delta
MTATIDKLVRSVNQIAVELGHQQSGDAAPAATCDHLSRSWDPGMRRQIIARLDDGGEGLSEAGRQAVALLRARDGENASGDAG